MLDETSGGRFSTLLTDWRRQGVAYEEIGRRLREEHNLTVSLRTVVRWCAEAAENEAEAVA